MSTRYKAPAVPSYTCITCGVATTLPFAPRSNQPVLCTDCWRKSKLPTGRRDDTNANVSLMTKPADRMYKAGLSWKWKPKP